jgi:hypothetical protein
MAKSRNKNKATHSGSCQCCGAQQKLPGDILSKHGYTVEYGWFSGVCKGSGHKPFEVSCELIERFILMAEEHKAHLEIEKAKWSQPATEDMCWVSVYTKVSYGVSTRTWEYAPAFEREMVSSSDPTYHWQQYFAFPSTSKLQKISAPYGSEDQTLRAACNAYNRNYVGQVIQPALDKVTEYIRWQRERVANWQPHPEKLQLLKEVK